MKQAIIQRLEQLKKQETLLMIRSDLSDRSKRERLRDIEDLKRGLVEELATYTHSHRTS